MMLFNKKKRKNKINIILSGGGTGGSVTPLLAIVNILRKDKNFVFDFLWVGTKKGPEKKMVKEAEIPFRSICSGKLRRYFSWENFLDIFRIILGFLESLYLLLKYKPDLVLSAGSFVSVPLAYAAWLLRVPIIIHQQDVRPGLANKLMSPLAKVITVTFEKSLKDYGRKAILIGNPVRQDLKINISFEEARSQLGIKKDKDVCLVIGGGTGALALNKLVIESLDKLSNVCQIIHITGRNKFRGQLSLSQYPDYYSFDFLSEKELALAYKSANLVVSRCGMGVLTELSFLAKPSILIPMPDSHQEDNARIFKEKKAAIVLNQHKTNKQIFVKTIKNLLADYELQQKLSENIKEVIKQDAASKIAKIIIQLISDKY